MISIFGHDLEKRVSNRDTLRKQWEEIMEGVLQGPVGATARQDHRLAMTQSTPCAWQVSLRRCIPNTLAWSSDHYKSDIRQPDPEL